MQRLCFSASCSTVRSGSYQEDAARLDQELVSRQYVTDRFNQNVQVSAAFLQWLENPGAKANVHHKNGSSVPSGVILAIHGTKFLGLNGLMRKSMFDPRWRRFVKLFSKFSSVWPGSALHFREAISSPRQEDIDIQY